MATGCVCRDSIQLSYGPQWLQWREENLIFDPMGSGKGAKQPVKIAVTVKLPNVTAQGAICPYFSLIGKEMESVMRA